MKLLPTSIVAATILLSGCRIGGEDSTDKVLNQLRAENAQLQKKLDVLTQERSELLAKMVFPKDTTHSLSDEELAALPRCAAITIDSLSGIAPRTQRLDFYIKTLDGTNQFVPVVGTMLLRISRGTEIVFEKKVSPTELRAAFRSGFTGTYYLFEAGKRDAAELQNAIFELSFDDALTGLKHQSRGGFDALGRVDVK